MCEIVEVKPAWPIALVDNASTNLLSPDRTHRRPSRFWPENAPVNIEQSVAPTSNLRHRGLQVVIPISGIPPQLY